MSIKVVMQKLWPIPPLAMRKDGLISRKLSIPCNLNNDGEYLFHQSISQTFFVGMAIFIILCADVFLKTGFLLNATDFYSSPLVLSEKFSNIFSIPCLFFTLLLYLRVRIFLNLKEDQTPFFARLELFETLSKNKFVAYSVLMFFLFTLVMFFSHIIVMRLVVHFDKQGSVFFVLFVQFLAIFAIAIVPAVIASWAIILEKTLRFFPELRRDISVEIERRKSEIVKN